MLFIIVLETLSNKFRIGLPWELFYADDLALLAESEEKPLVMKQWKDGMEQKGPKVDMEKVKERQRTRENVRQRTRENFHAKSTGKVLVETRYVAQNEEVDSQKV